MIKQPSIPAFQYEMPSAEVSLCNYCTALCQSFNDGHIDEEDINDLGTY